jgi:hypothetical protein
MTTIQSTKALLTKLYKAEEITLTAYYALSSAVSQIEVQDCESQDHKQGLVNP